MSFCLVLAVFMVPTRKDFFNRNHTSREVYRNVERLMGSGQKQEAEEAQKRKQVLFLVTEKSYRILAILLVTFLGRLSDPFNGEVTSLWVIKGSLGRSWCIIYRLVISVLISQNLFCLRSIPCYLVKMIQSEGCILVYLFWKKTGRRHQV